MQEVIISTFLFVCTFEKMKVLTPLNILLKFPLVISRSAVTIQATSLIYISAIVKSGLHYPGYNNILNSVLTKNRDNNLLFGQASNRAKFYQQQL